MLYLILLFFSGPNLGQARKPAWTKRPKKMSFLNFIILLRAKPRPSKKARLDKAAEEDVVLEENKTPNAEAAIPEDIPNDPPQQDDDLIAEERPTDTSGPIHQPTGSIRIESSTGPAKPTDKPTAPVQTGGTKDDEVKRPKKMSFLNQAPHPILKRLFLRVFPMIHRNQMMILLLRKDLLILQILSISPQVQCKPAVPMMMKLSLLELAILSQAILSLYPNILPRKNLLPLVKASGMLIWQLTLL